MTYQAPVEDILFALKSVADLEALSEQGIYDGVDEETLRAIVEEAGRFGAEVLAPLNKTGDRQGATLADGKVTTADGWSEAYRQFCEGGWNALTGPEDRGGQNLPEIVASATYEIWNAANLSFGLCPMLTMGAIDALKVYGSKELLDTYLPKMVSGEWTGTMNLTEPHAGSDLGALRTRAEPHEDGTYRLFGTKIFITYGDHDLTENIIHMVLARLPHAPAGTKGISLFLVPKVLVNPDGTLGERNDVTVAGVEHKLGIHASPTCTMMYGENGGAVGYMVGEPNRGLAAMFVMMNAARLGVGLQGVALAERATQHAIAYANERKQGRGPRAKRGEMSPIIEHADIRRTIIKMRALTQAARTICFATARELDVAERSGDKSEREAAHMRAAVLTPIAKAFSTDIGTEVASMGVQVHGGMGFIEETGAAQFYRDARILPIYEGTNGIQAIDLVTRKLPLGDGAVVAAMIDAMSETIDAVKTSNVPEFGRMGERLAEAQAALRRTSEWLGEQMQQNPEAALAGATPYLRLFGLTVGGVNLARGALAAARDNGGAAAARVTLARFFAEIELPATAALETAITEGAESILAMPIERLAV